ncbi:MAG: AAA family ATPase [Syntrophales bacterium]
MIPGSVGINKGFTIAVSGKGGVGKTGFSALLVKHLSEHGPVLAIDADPDSNLPQALGVEVKKNVGQAREAIVNAPARSAEADDKLKALEKALYEVVEETPKFDLVVMGRSEGLGCYCAVNNILRQVIDAKANNYAFTVIDCEAGLEHLSRRTTRDVDLMIAVTDATTNGVLTARRVQELSKELRVSFGEIMVVANKVNQEVKPLLDNIAQQNNLKIAAYIPYDKEVANFAISGKPIIDLPENSPVSMAVAEICRKILGFASA